MIILLRCSDPVRSTIKRRYLLQVLLRYFFHFQARYKRFFINRDVSHRVVSFENLFKTTAHNNIDPAERKFPITYSLCGTKISTHGRPLNDLPYR